MAVLGKVGGGVVGFLVGGPIGAVIGAGAGHVAVDTPKPAVSPGAAIKPYEPSQSAVKPYESSESVEELDSFMESAGEEQEDALAGLGQSESGTGIPKWVLVGGIAAVIAYAVFVRPRTA